MLVDSKDLKVNMSVSDLVLIACRKRERFQKIDNAIKDNPAFVTSLVKREEEQKGNRYHTDIKLSCSFKLSDILMELCANTSILETDGTYTIDIVKAVRYPIKLVDSDFVNTWLAEAKCMAFILAKKRTLENVNARICVFHTETLQRCNLEYSFSYTELQEFFKESLDTLAPFLSLRLAHIVSRDEKAINAPFPFSKAREGQKEISKEIYSAIKNKHNAIINAPTGLGKTAATMYPAIKAQAKGICNKIFYLTAKNSGNNSVLDAAEMFEKAGYDITVSVISAKAKICAKRPCSPKNCHYPNGHHERVMSAVLDIASCYKLYTYDVITHYAQKYNVCPFMLEMELVWFADLVVCDYNYVFDPSVSVKLSSSFSGNDVILVDEAHNLIDRLRHIFSVEINLKKLSDFSATLDPTDTLHIAINNYLEFVKLDTEDSGFACEPMSSQTLDAYERETNLLLSEFQERFESKRDATDPDIFTLCDSIKKFVDLLTLRRDDYLAFYNDEGNPEIFMVNTAESIFENSQKLGSFIMFSATLFPEEYYKYMLGARKNDCYVSFSSPFDSKNLLVLGYPLSTKYSDREQTIEEVVRSIWTAGRVKHGNYISFFPSYQYMALAINTFKKLFPDETVIYQKPSMTEAERNEFIEAFQQSPNVTLYAFAVLGGAFSEGIDLVGDKLSGATVVGLGSLPPSRKSALVCEYFSDLFFDGEKFAYHYPGLNKVFQAGGRVIRSENDKGFLLIIDDRFLTQENIELLPENWNNIKRVKDNNSIAFVLGEFW